MGGEEGERGVGERRGGRDRLAYIERRHKV